MSADNKAECEDKLSPFTASAYQGRQRAFLEKHLPIYRDLVYLQPQGACVTGTYRDYHRQYQDFVCRETDVWVASFPKSGTTWSTELAWCVLHGKDHTDVTKPLPTRAPFFEWDSLFEPGFLSALPADDFNREGAQWRILEAAGDPRMIKTHFPRCVLPKGVEPAASKVLYVCRDPRDVCVSLFNHSVKLDGYTGSFDQFVDLFLDDVYPWGPFWLNVLSYWEHLDSPNLLFITYEELKADLKGSIQKVARFLGAQRPNQPVGELGEKEVEGLLEHLSFNSMRNNPAVNEAVFETAAVTKEGFQSVKFMREGKVGGHKQRLTEQQAARFRQWTARWLQDSDFPHYRD